jgi:uncharacterized protein YbjT (DUF2867 family)
MSEPVLVLGATGNVGAPLLHQLLEQGVPVRALFDPSYGVAELPAGVEPFPGDYSDAALVRRAMLGADAVFMLTPPSPSQPAWHRTLVDAAVDTGVRRIVKLSAFDSGPDSPLQMGRWHYDGERVLRESGIDHVILRPQYFMQMLVQPLRAATGSGVFRGAAAGSLRMGFVHVRDIAAVAAVALASSDYSGSILVPTGATSPSFDEIGSLLSEATGSPVRYEQRSEHELRSSPPFTSWPEWHVADYLAIHGSAASDLVTTDVFDATGREPVDIRSFVDEVITRG